MEINDWVVILVDDEPDSLNLVHDILTLNGAEVHRASNGRQGLDELSRIIPTLIILDLAMPSPDGWEMLEEIRADPDIRRVPVVAITAYYSERVAERAFQAGFDAFFPKPIKASHFITKLKELVG
jgi:two-component system, cell cycle response regulator DivK